MQATALRIGISTLMLACAADAHAKKIDQIIYGLHGTANAIFYAVTTVFTVIGVWFVYYALMGLYKSSLDHAATPVPQRAYWVALLVGGALTSVSVWAVIAANTVA